MKAYFVYSHKKKEDSELLKRIKNWLPTNIDLQEADINKGELELIGLEEEPIAYLPNMLGDLERPFYMVKEVLDYLREVESVIIRRDDKKAFYPVLSDMRNENKLVTGKASLIEFVERLRKRII